MAVAPDIDAPLFLPADQAQQTVFEQPLNERMRTFLRLEFLFRQWLYHTEHQSPWATRAAVQTLLDIMTVLARGDIKSDIIKALDQCANHLKSFNESAGVDLDVLQAEITQLSQIQSQLQSQTGKLGQRVAEDEFLNTIRQRSTIPGGACEFDLPIMHHWLTQRLSERQQKLNIWFSDLMPLHRALKQLLWITRESAKTQTVIALKGVYQQSLPRHEGCQLIRVRLDAPFSVFPEISGSGYRFVVRFFAHQDEDAVNARSTTDDITFQLTCCQ